MAIQFRQNAEVMTRSATHVVLLDAETAGGIARGSLIRAENGMVAVETLREGDSVITRERPKAILRSIEPGTRRAHAIRISGSGLEPSDPIAPVGEVDCFRLAFDAPLTVYSNGLEVGCRQADAHLAVAS
jgi:hypothetical protein